MNIESPLTISPPRSFAMTRQDILNKIAVLEQMGQFDSVKKLKETYKEYLAPEVPLETQEWLNKFITKDDSMEKVKRAIGILSKHNDTVLLQGPTGTGKELLANALHGERPLEKFISVNCASLPDGLVESELFGHTKGAFTGASSESIGLFMAAEGGTIFLDEIGELPLSVQAKLLRVIQERKIRRVGSKVDEVIKVRIVCATLQDIEQRVEERLFREDLLHRINTFHIKLSPLSDRPEDIPFIAEQVAKGYEDHYKIIQEKCYPKEHYHIRPSLLNGNVRSIQQIIRKYHLLGELPV